MRSGAETTNNGSSTLGILLFRYCVQWTTSPSHKLNWPSVWVVRSIETIARLENALGIDLVKSALTYVSGYGSSVPSRPQYLSDSAGEKLDPDIKTSDFVEGYKHRKNAK